MSMAPMASSVEFLGLPGSGKSSAEDALASRLGRRGFWVHRFRDLADFFRVSRLNSPAYFRSLQALRSLGFSPPVYSKATSFLPKLGAKLDEFHSMVPEIVSKAVPTRVGQKNVARWLYSEVMAHHAWNESEVSNLPGHVLLADEAFLHRLAGLCAPERLGESDFLNFIRLRPHFDRAVFLQISPEESMRRKNNPPFQDPGLSHLLFDIRSGTATALSRIWNYLLSDEKLEIEVDSEPDDIARQIEMKLFRNAVR